MFLLVGGKCCKTDKVVKREICSIQTKGTKRLSFIDGDTTDCSSQFLLALCEKVRVLASAHFVGIVTDGIIEEGNAIASVRLSVDLSVCFHFMFGTD